MAGDGSVLKFNPLGWPNPPAALRYGLAVLSVVAAVLLISLMDAYLPAAPHVSLFLCAILFTTWFCGVRPGLLAVALSILAFDYFFVPPVNSLALEAGQLPRFSIFLLSTFFVWAVSASARRATGALVHARDELQRNNKALREREELMRVLTDNANDFIRLHTVEGRSVYASPSVERLYGRLPATMFEFAHPEDLEACRRWWERAVAGETGHLQWRVRDAGGNWRWLESSASLVRFKGQPHVLTVCRDITERIRAQEALQESEAKLKEAQRLAKIGYWESDLLADPITITLSEETQRFLGLGARRVLTQTELREMIHPDDRQFEKQTFDEVLQGGRYYDAEYRMVGPDGEVRFVHAWDEIAYDESGRPVCMFGTVQDITERKRAEEALREANSKLELILNTSPLPITGTDADGRITSWNKAAERLFGWTAEEAVGRMCPTIPPEQTEEYVGMIRRAMQGETYVGLVHYRQKKDGSLLTCSVSAAPQRNARGEPVGVTIIVEDITERRRAEEALRESRQLLQLVLATLPVGVIVTDQAGDITLANAASKRIWGDIITSGRQRWAQPRGFWHDSGKRIAPAAWASVRALSEGKTSLNELIDIETYDGQQKTIENSAAPIRNEEGLIVGAVIVNEDVTERVRAVEQLRRSNEELRSLSARLHSVREEESARIAREIHDELGAELSSLKWDLEEAGEDISELTDLSQLAALREKVASIITLTDNAVGTVQRISSELRPTALEEFGLAEALRWHAQQFQARTGIIVNCDCRIEAVDLNREQSVAVFRIYQEALTNVLRHAQATKVEIRIRQEDDHFALTINDDGRGITEGEKWGSQSLGLIGMRERTHLLGGEINIEGGEGRGTTITVKVPAPAKKLVGGSPTS
jgi:PAS domain S-box-containing protein